MSTMYPSTARPAKCASSAMQCTFFWHLNDTQSEPVVSHQSTETLMQMQLSLLRHGLRHSEKHAETDGTRNEERAPPPQPPEDGGCVDMENKDTSQAIANEACRQTDASSRHSAAPDIPENTLCAPHVLDSTQVGGSSKNSLAPHPSDASEQESKREWKHQAAGAAPLPPFLLKPVLLPKLPSKQRETLTRLNPLTLPVGAYISMFSSLAEYTRLTRCHRTGIIASQDIVECWTALVRCASACLFSATNVAAPPPEKRGAQSKKILSAAQRLIGPPCIGKFRDPLPPAFASTVFPVCDVVKRPTYGALLLSGVYVHRLSSTAFEMGFVTQGGRPYYEVVNLMAHFIQVLGLPIPHMHGTLAIGAALRGVALKIWWTPQTKRVMPGTLLAPIKVVVVEQYHSDDVHQRSRVAQNIGSRRAIGAEENMRFFRGYDCVTLFLIRPIVSRLRGTCQVALPHDPASCTVWARASELEQRVEDDVDFDDSRIACPNREPSNKNDDIDSLACGAVSVVRLSSGGIRASLRFSNLSVTTTGEHMVAVEVRPTMAYRPFIPTLCGYVTPFLVVPQGTY